MELTHEVTQQLAQIARDHEPLKTKEGWVDCTCGWESNHPVAWSEKQLKAQADPGSSDPIDGEGGPDEEHVGNSEPQQDHVAALQMAYLQTAQ